MVTGSRCNRACLRGLTTGRAGSTPRCSRATPCIVPSVWLKPSVEGCSWTMVEQWARERRSRSVTGCRQGCVAKRRSSPGLGRNIVRSSCSPSERRSSPLAVRVEDQTPVESRSSLTVRSMSLERRSSVELNVDRAMWLDVGRGPKKNHRLRGVAERRRRDVAERRSCSRVNAETTFDPRVPHSNVVRVRLWSEPKIKPRSSREVPTSFDRCG